MTSNLKIRIFVDAHVFDGEFQGTRTFIKGIYTVLAEKPDVHLYLAAHNTDILKAEFPTGSNISFIKYRSKSSAKRLLFEIPCLVDEYKIDYAHFQYISPARKKCKSIVTIHDLLFIDYPQDFPWLYRWTRTILFKRSSLQADVLTTVSEYSKEAIQRHFKIPADKIHITPNAVRPKFFDDYDRSEAIKFIYANYGIENYLLYVSRIEPRKNHELLVSAFVDLKLHDKGLKLVLVGHRSLAAEGLDNLLKTLSNEIRGSILIINEISDNDLLQFYRAARVFIYPSKAEGFGIPPLEAAALRIPVLCSNATAMSDFSFFEPNFFDPADYDVFKEKLLTIIRATPDSDGLEWIASLIRSRYSWIHSAETLYLAIKEDFKGNNGFSR